MSLKLLKKYQKQENNNSIKNFIKETVHTKDYGASGALLSNDFSLINNIFDHDLIKE